MTVDPGFIHVYEPGSGDSTLLLLHGTGGDESDLLPLGRQLAPAANLLSPRGKVLEAGMPRFFRRLAPGELDIPDLRFRTDELAAFIRESAGHRGFDPDRTIAVGLSNGANIAASLLMMHPGLIGGACLLRPMLPYPPPSDLDLDGTRVLIASGGKDPMVAAEEPGELAEAFEAAGAEVELRLDPAAGHGLTQGDLEAARTWLQQKP